MHAAYVDLKKAFDSVHRESLWDLLRLRGIPARTIGLMTGLYSGTESAVKCGAGVSSFFPVNTGVRQGCVLAPSLFNTCMDWVLGKVVDQSDCGASLGNTKITDLVFADDAVIFAESLEVLVMAFEALHEQAKPLGLEVSWLKTKVQVFGGLLDETGQSVHACGEDIEILESFTYVEHHSLPLPTLPLPEHHSLPLPTLPLPEHHSLPLPEHHSLPLPTSNSLAHQTSPYLALQMNPCPACQMTIVPVKILLCLAFREGYLLKLDYEADSENITEVRLQKGRAAWSRKVFDLSALRLPKHYSRPLALTKEKVCDLQYLLDLMPVNKQTFYNNIIDAHTVGLTEDVPPDEDTDDLDELLEYE
ncbi:Retrovirus-related Pol polyprotein from type-1 retrotransposable element R2 [Chionoecetes opilio]|uniref:Retrovirus-related Pol polyprotein from type-1 retrotransposable element R2 n=1 Tax=Chionoecetes opilio TaxID=41210 RepID=A0A8J4YSN1_CHIOP|nr:Retrovirus-related Pol polyprotein from type-1 retrotransposable element R2 [Chionoecetes opilio]